ncbi:hypothetical protein B0H14DRAFT_3165560 [Mycena olivaceomarginata]|nr:hypothetical protein B0H14DRAFT_3165560 [Mycena olivaceomarginata]
MAPSQRGFWMVGTQTSSSPAIDQEASDLSRSNTDLSDNPPKSGNDAISIRILAPRPPDRRDDFGDHFGVRWTELGSPRSKGSPSTDAVHPRRRPLIYKSTGCADAVGAAMSVGNQSVNSAIFLGVHILRKSIGRSAAETSIYGETSCIENIDFDSRRQPSRVETKTSDDGRVLEKRGLAGSGASESDLRVAASGVTSDDALGLQSASSMALTGRSFVDVLPSILKSLTLGGRLQGVGRRRRVGGGRQEQSTGTNKATAPDRPE